MTTFLSVNENLSPLNMDSMKNRKTVGYFTYLSVLINVICVYVLIIANIHMYILLVPSNISALIYHDPKFSWTSSIYLLSCSAVLNYCLFSRSQILKMNNHFYCMHFPKALKFCSLFFRVILS